MWKLAMCIFCSGISLYHAKPSKKLSTCNNNNVKSASAMCLEPNSNNKILHAGGARSLINNKAATPSSKHRQHKKATESTTWKGGKVVSVTILSHKFTGDQGKNKSHKGEDSFDHTKLRYTIQISRVSTNRMSKKKAQNNARHPTVTTETWKAMEAFDNHREAVEEYNEKTKVPLLQVLRLTLGADVGARHEQTIALG
jgi:hypothetical protein